MCFSMLVNKCTSLKRDKRFVTLANKAEYIALWDTGLRAYY